MSYLTPGLMAAGVTEVIVEKDQFVEAKDDTKTLKNNTPPTTTKALTHQSKKSKWIKKIHSENKKIQESLERELDLFQKMILFIIIII